MANLASPDPGRWPKLSVIVPACNEQDEMESAFRSLLAEGYPNTEFILVDDRSTDETGRIADRLAASDPRVRVIHITELPEGWLGKVHALDRGYRVSSGEFVLFTDADVHFTPGGLRKVVAWCVAEKIDHVAAFPDAWSISFLLDALIFSFVRPFIALVTRPWAVPDPDARAFLGVGAFNLVRRSAFDATPGFGWIRMEVADDMGVGYMMKRSRARCVAIAAIGYVGLYWYRTFRDAMRGAEKAYAIGGCRLLAALPAVAISLAMEIAPLVLLLPLLSERYRFAGLAGMVVLASFVLSIITLNRWVGGGRLLAGLASPFLAPLMAWVGLRAALVGFLRGGVTWRGTLYPSAILRAGRRVKFF